MKDKIFILLFLEIFLGCQTLFGNETNKVSLQLKWKHQFQFAGFYMANEKGFYKEVGLDVAFNEFDKKIDIIEEVEKGEIDFAIDDSALIYHKLNGAEIVALFPIFQNSPIVLIAQEKFQNIHDLTNTKVEFSVNELLNISINAMLQSQNIKVNPIKHTLFVNHFIEQKSDAIVGYLSNQPYYLKTKSIPYLTYNPKDYGFDFYGDILYTSTKLALNNPKLVKEFIQASKKGWEYAFKNPSETIQIIYEKYNTQNKSMESLQYEATTLQELSGYGNNFGVFNHQKIRDIAQTIKLLYPQKYLNNDLENFLFFEDKWEKFIAFIKLYSIYIGTILFLIILIILAYIIFINRLNSNLNEWIDSTIEGIAIFEGGKLIRANKQLVEMLGYSHFHELKTKKHTDFIHPDSLNLLEHNLKINETQPYEIVAKRKDGTYFDALVKGKVIAHKNQRISSMVDISALKKAQKDLIDLNNTLNQKIKYEVALNKQQQTLIFQKSRLEEMGEMLSMIAHQWRQPLNTISLIVNNIILKYKNEKLTPETANELKLEFQKQIHYMSKTIDDFQNFFKPTKEKTFFYLETTILETIELLSPIFKKNKIQISLHKSEAIKFFGYETEFKQVLLNILNNAKDILIENKIPTKQIVLTIERNNEAIFIHCQDNGGGITEKIINNIFDPYFSTKNHKNGTGLGLYISKVIIEEHFHGTLKVVNTKDGAKFTILLYPNY